MKNHLPYLLLGLAACSPEKTPLPSSKDTALEAIDESDTPQTDSGELLSTRNELLARILDHAAGEAADLGHDAKLCLKKEDGAYYDPACPEVMDQRESDLRTNLTESVLGASGEWSDLPSVQGAAWAVTVDCSQQAPWSAQSLSITLPTVNMEASGSVGLYLESGYTLDDSSEKSRFTRLTLFPTSGTGMDCFGDQQIQSTSRYYQYIGPEVEGLDPVRSQNYAVNTMCRPHDTGLWDDTVDSTPVDITAALETQERWHDGSGTLIHELLKTVGQDRPVLCPADSTDVFSASGQF